METKNEFKIEKSSLLQGLMLVGQIIPNKAIVPYTHILFEANKESLLLTGSDTENQLQTPLKVISSTGIVSFCLSKEIIGILKTLPEQPISITAIRKKEEEKIGDKTRIKITMRVELKHSAGKINLPAELPDLYNKLSVKNEETFQFPAHNLKRGLDAVKKAADNNDLRPMGCGVYIDIKENSIVFVATDRNVLLKFTDFNKINTSPIGILINNASVNVLSSMLKGKENVDITTGEKSILFKAENIELISRKTEGKYYNYDSVFPEELPIEANIESELILSAIDRLVLVGDSASSILKIEVGPELKLSTEDVFFSKSATETLSAVSTGNITIGLNGKCLQEILPEIPDTVQFLFCDSTRPVVIQPAEQEENTEFKALLMSMMINN